ncbi:hypothetical protein GDO86_004987 [Hymenochirus boettgeri]|uniref:Uncharacterized protein n=1 Tax=Hymenochirus boettgeri TaxID=247094 RepID=A0A8T2J006_9PIPI|nr:hypothetical protein GDO86_004987 [Hymenochirus boettgeri]
MSQQGLISTNSTSTECPGGTRRERSNGGHIPPNSNFLHTREAAISSAVLIGHRLSVIGDEFNRTYDFPFQSRISHIFRISLRLASQCQTGVRNLLRRVQAMANRVGNRASQTAGQSSQLPTRDPKRMCSKLLFALGLIAASGIVIKLGLDH